MKRLLLLIFICITFIACATSSSENLSDKMASGNTDGISLHLVSIPKKYKKIDNSNMYVLHDEFRDVSFYEHREYFIIKHLLNYTLDVRVIIII